MKEKKKKVFNQTVILFGLIPMIYTLGTCWNAIYSVQEHKNILLSFYRLFYFLILFSSFFYSEGTCFLLWLFAYIFCSFHFGFLNFLVNSSACWTVNTCIDISIQPHTKLWANIHANTSICQENEKQIRTIFTREILINFVNLISTVAMCACVGMCVYFVTFLEFAYGIIRRLLLWFSR